MKNWIEATEQLVKTLEQENAALAALEMQRATSLLPAKMQALAAFEQAKEFLSSLPEVAEERDTLSGRLRELVAENRRLLERAMTVQGRVIEIVVSAIPAEDLASRYGTPAKAYGARTRPLTLSARA